MRGDDVLQRGEHGFGAAGEASVPVGHHLADLLPLQVRLRAAQVAGDDREFHAAREGGDVGFRRVGERADDDVRAVVGDELRWHRLQLGGEQQVEEQRVHDVVAVMAERDLVAAEFLGDAVDDAAAQARAERAGRLAGRDLLLDDRVGVLLDDAELDAELAEVLGQDVRREAGLLLVEVHRDQAELDRRALLQRHQQREQRVRVLAAGDADEDGVAVLDHVVVGDRPTDVAEQAFLQALQIA